MEQNTSNPSNLTFLNLGVRHPKQIPSDTISLAYDNNNTRRITLNSSLSKKLSEGKYMFLRVGFNEYSTDCYFIFCKKQTPDALVINPEARKTTIVINSKYLVDALIEKMNLPKRAQILKISGNSSNSSDYMTFRVSKQ